MINGSSSLSNILIKSFDLTIIIKSFDLIIDDDKVLL